RSTDPSVARGYGRACRPVLRRRDAPPHGSHGTCAVLLASAVRRVDPRLRTPKPNTHERLPSSSRKPTERTRAARSAQKDRIAPRFPAPGLAVTTRKIAARVRGIATD